MAQKTHERINSDVVERLHKYRVNKLGNKATISDAISSLLEEVK